MGLFQFNDLEILAFFLVLVRMSSFIASWPVFGSALVPPVIKVLMAFVVSIVVFPTVGWQHLQTELSSSMIVWLTVREAFIGFALGYLGRLFFFAVTIAAQIISLSMGLSNAQLFNPVVGSSTSPLEQTYIVVATLFFLAVNGHHLFLSGIVDSYTVVPLSAQLLSLSGFGEFGVIGHQILTIGVKMCAPVLMAILFMNMAMAVIGRTVPQINVLITSLPVNIMVGYIVIFVSMPLLVWQMQDLLNITADRFFEILKSF